MSIRPNVRVVSSTSRRSSSLDEMLAPGGGVDRVCRLNAGFDLARRDHDLGAVLGEALRDRPADAPRRAGDDGDAAAEIKQIGQGFLP
jgi:hypothetical protein